MTKTFAVRRTDERLKTYERVLEAYSALPNEISAKSFDTMMTILLTIKGDKDGTTI